MRNLAKMFYYTCCRFFNQPFISCSMQYRYGKSQQAENSNSRWRMEPEYYAGFSVLLSQLLSSPFQISHTIVDGNVLWSCIATKCSLSLCVEGEYQALMQKASSIIRMESWDTRGIYKVSSAYVILLFPIFSSLTERKHGSPSYFMSE